jgi:D-alanine-D-alanine ligase-like ATP-grasp enzyme/acylphosphatase
VNVDASGTGQSEALSVHRNEVKRAPGGGRPLSERATAAAVRDPEPAPEWTFHAWNAFSRSYWVHRQLVKQAAFVRNLEVEVIAPDFYLVSDGNRKVAFWKHTPQTTTFVARQITLSKVVTKTVLERAGIRVPPGRVFSRNRAASAWRFAESLGFPVVLKPPSSSGGSGVTSEISTESHFQLAWTSATKVSRTGRVIVEKHVPGKDFRLYVVGDRLVAAAHRVPAYVEGDGSSSITELVAKKNAQRRSNPYVGGKAMKLTPVMLRNLSQMGLGPDSILESGRRVTLHPIANIGAGGESVDVTDEVHPDFREIGVRACGALPGTANVGVDLLVDDISAPAEDQEWAVCEVNSRPDIGMHHFPVWGTPRDAAGVLIEHLFPGSRRCEPEEQRGVRVLISGRVSAVGFRRWIWLLANLRGLTGWVRNRGEDSVEAAFRGAPHAVDDTLRLCRAGPPKAAVADVALEPSAEVTSDDFEIRP